MNEIIREFLLETYENLAQLDLDLVTLEKEPSEREALGERGILGRIFRTFHTIKGTAGFLNLIKLQAVSHAAENLLSRLRAGELAFNPEIATALLGAVDVIKKILSALEATQHEGDGDYSAIVHILDQLTGGTGSAVRLLYSGSPQPILKEPAQAKPVLAPNPPPEPIHPSPRSASSSNPATVVPDRLTPTSAKPSAQVIPSARGPVAAISPYAATLIGAPIPRAPSNLDTRGTESVPSKPPAIKPPAAVPPPSADASETRVPVVSDSSIRVDVGLLDKLMTLVGELVLARNQIMQYSASQEDAGFLSTVQRLNLLTTELQAGVMKTRMQPIGNVWAKFPRIVRDMALACRKTISIEMDGQETELDKTIVEAIRDPLTHMIRNAVDHGIELPENRVAAGKAAEGRLFLHAFHEGGKVIIEIRDDGGGIDPARVKDKAIQNKIISPESAARLSERELVNLVFLPGFSTADRVTNFSGRGVGMDVVRTNIEKIGGTVDIASQVGRGTTVKMKIPLTLAIIPALTITTGGDCYAIPQVNLLELVRLEGEQLVRGLERIHGATVYRLRGNLLPLIYLDEQLQLESAHRTRSELNIVVLQADDRQFGLIVDDIHDTEEIVVKPLQKQLKGVSVFAGATIMGDGRVALILDVLGLAQRSGVVSGIRERAMTEKTSAAEHQGDRQTVLLFVAPGGGRMALPLAQVARLEEFPRSTIERIGRSEMVQYRGEILPLLRISRLLGAQTARASKRHRKRVANDGETRANGTDITEDKRIHVVVYSEEGRQVGLVVSRILDIVETTITKRSHASRPGVLFKAVVQERVTEFLDMEAIIRMGAPELFENTLAIPSGNKR